MNVKARKSVSVLSLVVACFIGVTMFSTRADAVDFLLTPEPTSTLQPCYNNKIYDVAFSPDGQFILTTWEFGQIRLWKTDTGELIRTFDQPNGGSQTLTFSPDGNTILSVGYDAFLWDVETGMKLYEFPRDIEDSTGTSVEFTSDGKYAITGGLDGASVWDVQSGKKLHSFPGEMDQPTLNQRVRITSNGQYLMTTSASEQKIFVWDMNTGENLHTFDGITALLSADSQYIVTYGYEGLILWDLATFQQVHIFDTQLGRIAHWEFSADSKYLLIGFYTGIDAYFDLWDVETGRNLFHFPLPLLDNVYGILPDSQHLLMPQAASRENQDQVHVVDVWDIGTGTITKTFSMGDAEVSAFQFSSDGQDMVIGTFHGEIQLWDIEQGEMIRQFCGN